MHRARLLAWGGIVATSAVVSCAGRPSVTHDELGARVIVSSATQGGGEAPVIATPQATPHVVIGKCEDGTQVEHFTVAHLNDLQARYSDRIDGHSRYGYIAGYLAALKE